MCVCVCVCNIVAWKMYNIKFLKNGTFHVAILNDETHQVL